MQLDVSTLAKLDVRGKGTSSKIYFYNDATDPGLSPENMKAYMDKLALLFSSSVSTFLRSVPRAMRPRKILK